MNRYAAALSQHPIPAHAVGEVAGSVLEQLDGEPPDLVVYFASPHFVGALDDMNLALRRLLEPGALIGMTASAVISGSVETETEPALSVWAGCMDGVVSPVGFQMLNTADGPAISGWPAADPDDTDDPTSEAHTLLLLADPFTFPVEAFVARLADDRPDVQVIGGLASAAQGPGGNRLAIDDELRSEGAVGVLLSGGPPVQAVVSQGCRPVGSAYIVTGSEDNVVRELGGKPALERLAEVADALSEDERLLLSQGLQIGIVVNEHQAEFGRGDFLVRSVLGASKQDGSISVGTSVAVGRTVQFQVRDAIAADEDLRALLAEADARSALLFACTGRGERLFGVANHDAELVEEMLGPLPLAGAFCAGELGPVGGRNHVHAFTASLALFDA
ncbi:MAG: FIST signal transduction protein [Acidimicrobiia bacterium]